LKAGLEVSDIGSSQYSGIGIQTVEEKRHRGPPIALPSLHEIAAGIRSEKIRIEAAGTEGLRGRTDRMARKEIKLRDVWTAVISAVIAAPV
jgi:hypothetical protein